MHTLEHLVRLLTEKGIVTLPAGVLCSYLGHRRLGRVIVKAITKQLEESGIRYQPSSYPNDYRAPVRFWLAGTKMDDIIQAATVPEHKNDLKLLTLVGAPRVCPQVPDLYPDVPTEYIDYDIPRVR